MTRLLMFGAHFIKFKSIFQFFSKIAPSDILVFTPQTTLVNYDSLSLELGISSDFMPEFVKHIQEGDILYLGGHRTFGMKNQEVLKKCTIIARHNDEHSLHFLKSLDFTSKLLDLIFNENITEKQIQELCHNLESNTKIQIEYKAYASQNVESFFKWFCANFNNLPKILTSSTTFQGPLMLRFCDFNPTIPLNQNEILDSGPPYLSVKNDAAQFDPKWAAQFDPKWLKHKNLFGFWYNFVVKEYYQSGSISLSKGCSLFSLIPALFKHKFKFSRRLCIKIALFGLIHFNEKSIWKNKHMFDLCLEFLGKFKKIEFKQFSTQCLLIFFQYLSLHPEQKKLLLLHRGIKQNISYCSFHPVTFKPIKIVLVEPLPYTSVVNWLMHPKSNKVPEGVLYLIKENQFESSIAKRWKKIITEISKNGKLFEPLCNCGCKKFTQFDKCLKLCDSAECGAIISKKCSKLSLNQQLFSKLCLLGPGKFMPFDLESILVCFVCNKGRLLPLFRIPQLPPFSIDQQSTHRVLWCKICHESKLVPIDSISKSMLSYLESQYFVCQNETCQQLKETRTCPSCHHGVQRIDGCNDILCRCGERFCYGCLRHSSFCYIHRGYPCVSSYNHHPIIKIS